MDVTAAHIHYLCRHTIFSKLSKNIQQQQCVGKYFTYKSSFSYGFIFTVIFLETRGKERLDKVDFSLGYLWGKIHAQAPNCH